MKKILAFIKSEVIVTCLCVVIVGLTVVLVVSLFSNDHSNDVIATKVLAEEEVRVPQTTPEGVPVTTPAGKKVYETKKVVKENNASANVQASDNKSSASSPTQPKPAVTQTTKKTTTPTTQPFTVNSVKVLGAGPSKWNFDGTNLVVSQTWNFYGAVSTNNNDAIGKSVQMTYTWHFQNGMSTSPKTISNGQHGNLNGSIDLGLEDCQAQWYYLEVKWAGGSMKTANQNLVWPSTANGYCNKA